MKNLENKVAVISGGHHCMEAAGKFFDSEGGLFIGMMLDASFFVGGVDPGVDGRMVTL